MRSFAFAVLVATASAIAVENLGSVKLFDRSKPVSAWPFSKQTLKYVGHTSGEFVERSRVPRVGNYTIKKAIRYGPYTLPSMKDKVRPNFLPPGFGNIVPVEKGELQSITKVKPLCTDCFVVMGSTYMEYEDGSLATAASGVYNHHAVIFDMDKRALALDCAHKTFAKSVAGPSIFVGSAADGGNLDDLLHASPDPNPFPRGSYTQKGAEMMSIIQLMNYRPEPQKIYVVAEAEYLPGKPEGYMESTTIGLSVTGCNPVLDFLVPSPQYSRSGPDIIVPKDAMLVSMSGHMHDGGSQLDMKINGKTACMSNAMYSTEDIVKTNDGMEVSSIIGMSRCYDHIALKKGDRLSVTGHYDLAKHPMRTSNTGEAETVMGVGFFEIVIPLGSEY